MNITDFRDIGKKLLIEIPSVTSSPDMRTPRGQGAAGDSTFSVDRVAGEFINQQGVLI